MSKILSIFVLPVFLIGLLFYFQFFVPNLAPFSQNQISQIQNGDIIFIDSGGAQGQAIRLATRSKWTHMGIIFIENNEPIVYHAVDPVRKDSLPNFLKYSKDTKWEIKRLKNTTVLTVSNLEKMKQKAKKLQGLPYDYLFNWGDEEIYCSEYVWKIYQEIGLKVGELSTLKDFDLTSSIVQKMLKERYSDQIPLSEPVIPPSTMFDSELLNTAIKN